MRAIIIFLFFGVAHLCDGSKILSIVPTPSKSHHNIIERLVVELTKKGHEVTLVTPFKQSKSIPRLKELIIPDLYQNMSKLMGSSDSNEAMNTISMMRKMSKWIMPFLPVLMGSTIIELLVATPEIQSLIKSEEKYDVIIAEPFLIESLIAGFSHKFDARIIGISGFMPNFYANVLIGNPAPLAYVPDTILGHTHEMNFWERFQNTIFGFLLELNYRLFHVNKQDQVMRKHFGENLPPLEDIIKNTSLVLVNHHFSLAFPRPYLPNMIEIGGYHINPPKSLPADLKKFFDESKHGVILFSFGSHIKSADLPKETKQEILKAFSKLKQDVIWKFEDDTLTNVPKNVKIMKWTPQSDILAHPNLKLFVTHGGLLSTTEAVYRGVPIVGIPVGGDQPINMKYTTAAGFGLSLELDDLSESNLYEAITEVLNNPKYRENVKRGSAIIQDNPLSAIDTAIYWIEYVLRHKGAPHLRSAAQDLSWYQLYLLDVLGFITIVSFLCILVSLSVIKFIVKRILSLICKKTTKVPRKKKEN